MDNSVLIFCLNIGDFAVNTYIVACPKTWLLFNYILASCE